MRQAIIFTLILVLLSGLGFAACPDGMVSYWTFDNDSVSGNTALDSQGVYDGNIYGANKTSGRVNNAISLDGLDDYVNVSNNLGLSDHSFSISGWFKTTSFSRSMLVAKHYAGIKEGFLIGTNFNNEKLDFYVGGGGEFSRVIGGQSIVDNSWHHFVITLEKNNLAQELYTDGTLDSSMTGESLSTANSPLLLGALLRSTGPSDFFKGKLDEIAIFNRSLNASEIQQLYNQSSQGYDYCGTYKNTLPLSSKFTEFPSTTNFSQVQNLSAVENLTLGSPHGTISFGNNTVNAENQDYNKNVVFGDCFVAVNATALDYTFNATAYLLMNNSDGHCGDNTIFVTSQVVADAGAIKNGSKICQNCKKVKIGEDTVTFKVPHFSSYAIGSNSNITIDADDPKLVNQTVTFTAVYRNSSSGDFISSANCQIDLPGGTQSMTEGTDKYTYQTSFTENQTYSYNVTCSKSGYNTLLVEDSFQILPAGEAVPEFSSIAIFALITITIAGVFLWRKRK